MAERKVAKAKEGSAGGAKPELEKMGKQIVEEIKKGENPRFVATTRTRSNILYDAKVGYLRLGKNEEERSFLNVAQSKKFMQT
ncbi:MAG: hypothetical protein KGH74_05520, partial [Candidatus Micrarchaeota archaeon]|nr:hypothetical protein [Candidatus Micrarchaeota archaeon]